MASSPVFLADFFLVVFFIVSFDIVSLLAEGADLSPALSCANAGEAMKARAAVVMMSSRVLKISVFLCPAAAP